MVLIEHIGLQLIGELMMMVMTMMANEKNSEDQKERAHTLN